ncbi:uncharacterized protein LOC141827048 [Curcuma longa]|uniref:uncharacterized protein LOC141827048 n=1 Tax=Curcuma longa TaxID=136217 RepID=UPI003D9DD1D7
MKTIIAAIFKLKGCIRQIEELNPSGASAEDIMNRAQMLLVQDPNYSKLRVSNLDMCRAFFKSATTTAQADYSQSYKLEKDVYSSSSSRVSSFNLNITDSDSGDTLTKRPIGVKKVKLKKKNEQPLTKKVSQNDGLVAALDRSIDVAIFKEENKISFKDLNIIADPKMHEFIHDEQNDELVAVLDRSTDVAIFKEENKILFKDLNIIADPIMGEFIHGEQVKMMQKMTKNQKSQLIPH